MKCRSWQLPPEISLKCPYENAELESLIMAVENRPTLRIGFSPDPDDAFMWWALVTCDGSAREFDTGEFQYEAVINDINR